MNETQLLYCLAFAMIWRDLMVRLGDLEGLFQPECYDSIIACEGFEKQRTKLLLFFFITEIADQEYYPVCIFYKGGRCISSCGCAADLCFTFQCCL